MLLVIPNISEGRDQQTIEAVGNSYVNHGARLLDTHADADHNRTVHTLAVEDHSLIPEIVTAGAIEAANRIDITTSPGLHPRVGALDVAPVVYLRPEDRGAACAAALTTAHTLSITTQVPVFLYGLLANDRTRAELRQGGPQQLQQRITNNEQAPDFGPRHQLHPTAGATLVAARPPLVAFNIELAPQTTLATARHIAADIREGGLNGLRGVRALGLQLTHEDGLRLTQVTTNVEDHRATSLAALVAAVRAQAEVTGTELVGLAPEAALADFPADIPMRNRRTIEQALGSGPPLSS